MNERISKPRLLAAYNNGVGKRMKSSAPPSELPALASYLSLRGSVQNMLRNRKTPLQQLTGSSGSAKRDKKSQVKHSDCQSPVFASHLLISQVEICACAQNAGHRPTVTVLPVSTDCAATVLTRELKLFLIKTSS